MIREHDGSTLEDPLEQPLTWDQIAERHGHHCLVLWDRDMAAIDWEPRFVERRGASERVDRGDHYEIVVRTGCELWADDAGCLARMRQMGKLACRCHRWDRSARLWLPRITDQAAREAVDAELFRKRLREMELTRSTARAIVIDSDVPYASVHEYGAPPRRSRR